MEDKSLPQELVLHIFLFLPIKSLMQFRCVNKTFLELLTNDPHFTKLYLYQLNKTPSLISNRHVIQDKTYVSSAIELTDCDQVVDLKLPFSSDHDSYHVHSILNGLLLVTLENDTKKVFIWNPLTNEYLDIPYPSNPHNYVRTFKMVTSFGFGFLQVTNQYKAVRFLFCYERTGAKLYIGVYTLGTDSFWRNLGDTTLYRMFIEDCVPPLVNGALHWVACTGKINSHSIRIVSFDLKDEVFKEIPLLDDTRLNKQFGKIGVLNGMLCILGLDSGRNIQIWVMQEYGVADSWILQFTIRQAEVLGSSISLSRPTSVAHNGEILFTNSDRELFLYNPGTNSIRSLKAYFNAYTYTASLISPRVICRGGCIM